MAWVEFPVVRQASFVPFFTVPSILRTCSISLTFLPSLALVEDPEVDINSDAWAEYDYRCQPPQEDLMDDPTYKDGFYMGCCYNRPYDPGCVVSRHKPKVDPLGNKRVRR
jgi:hypothetical protein